MQSSLPANFIDMKEKFAPSLPDSPVSCTEDRPPYWDKAEEAVLWSNAAFRSYDMVGEDGDGDGSSSSARTSLCSIPFNEDWKGLGRGNDVQENGMGDEHANGGGLARNASRSPGSESVEKPKLCGCHVQGGPVVIAVNVSVGGVMAAQGCHAIYRVDGNPRQNEVHLHCECQAPGGRIHGSPAGKRNSLSPGKECLLEGFPPRPGYVVEKGKDGGGDSQIYLNRGKISAEEAKIKAELENEIEKDLENEIKDGICDLTRKLAELYAHQKARSGDAQRPTSGNTGNGGNVVGVSSLGRELGSLCPQDVPSTPPISSFRQTELSPIGSGDSRSGGKSSGGGKPWEKKNRRGAFEKDFDWVRTLRASSTTSSPEANKSGKPNCTVAAPERLCSDPTAIPPRGCSRALFMEYGIPSNRDEEASISKPRRCRRHGCSHSSKEDNAVHVALRGCARHCDKVSPTDGDSGRGKCGTENGALKRMGNRKGPAEPIGLTENVRNAGVGGNSEEERFLLTDMMNRLQISDTGKDSGEKPRKVQFSEATKLLRGKEG